MVYSKCGILGENEYIKNNIIIDNLSLGLIKTHKNI